MTPAHQYCVEFYERTVENLKKFHDQSTIEMSTIEKICAKDEFMSLAIALNNAKITSIVETMQMSKNPLSKANPNPRSFKKITRAQCQAVARALLAQYDNSAMNVIDAAFAAELRTESRPSTPTNEPEISKNPVSVDALVAIGGKKWESPDKSKSRVYFGTSFIATAIGFEYTTYKTGNISSASLKGESLSNSRAKSLLSSIAGGKFWYDVISGEFVSDKLPNSHSEIEAYIQNAIDK